MSEKRTMHRVTPQQSLRYVVMSLGLVVLVVIAGLAVSFWVALPILRWVAP